MAHDVFISYSSADKEIAEAVCSAIESREIRCWIAPRDILPGTEYGEAIVRALNDCRLMVLIFSASANASPQVRREVERAVSKRITLLPFRVEEVAPGPSLEYFLGSVHWLDAFPLSWESHLERLAGAVSYFLQGNCGGRDAATGSERCAESGEKQELDRPAGRRSVEELKAVIRKLPEFWHVPNRNLRFTGREETLEQLRRALVESGRVALSGLPGVGKTHAAIEYAYRYRADYRSVFWVTAETRDGLVAGFAGMARVLDLPVKDEPDQNVVVEAVKRRLDESADWLLILDNVDDVALVREFIPSNEEGHALLTTRAAATGGVARQRVELLKMSPQEGASLLLRRAGLLRESAPLEFADPRDRSSALAIAAKVDGLPLALDHAGAFIEATPSTPAEYLTLYETEGAALRSECSGSGTQEHASVSTTFSLAFQKVVDANRAAADLLRLCAFLAPEAIPEGILTDGAADLGDDLGPAAAQPLARAKAIQETCRFSLLRRDPEARTLTIHRLVQDVLKDCMGAELQQLWAERAVRAVSRSFSLPEFSNWPQCGRLVVHAQACAELIARWGMALPEAGCLLYNAGVYLRQRAQYTEAEPLQRRALAIREQVLGPEHPDVARSLNGLAGLLREQGQFVEAEPLYRRALETWEQARGSDHPDVARVLNNLAILYDDQGQYTEAEPLYLRALAIREQSLGPDHPDVAETLNNLGVLCNNQDRFAESESLYRRALAIREKALGAEHPDVADTLNNLAALTWEQGRYAEAEPLFCRALAIWERALGPEHPRVAAAISNLAVLCHDGARYAEAEPLFLRALAIWEQSLGSNHPDVAETLNGLAQLYQKQGRYAEAEPLLRRAQSIYQQTLGPEHPETATSLGHLAELLHAKGDRDGAQRLLCRALEIRERVLGPEHAETVRTRAALASMQESYGAR